MSKIKNSFFENLAGYHMFCVRLRRPRALGARAKGTRYACQVRARNFSRSSARKYNIGPVTGGKCGVIPGPLTPASWLKVFLLTMNQLHARRVRPEL